MRTEPKVTEQKVQIARYRLLEQEVTDPLAAGLLHIIIAELEADIDRFCQKECETGDARRTEAIG